MMAMVVIMVLNLFTDAKNLINRNERNIRTTSNSCVASSKIRKLYLNGKNICFNKIIYLDTFNSYIFSFCLIHFINNTSCKAAKYNYCIKSLELILNKIANVNN